MLGGTDDETIFRVSEADDPDTYLGTTGFVKPSQNDGERAICAREFRTQLYLFKEHAGFLVNDDAANPSDWTVDKRWDRVGPVGPWAVDVNESFMVFLDTSGLYYYDGSLPANISDEICTVNSQVWGRINWQVAEKFWVFIDTEQNEIQVGVAFDQSTVPNKILKMSFINGVKQGARKWSIDDIPANKALLAYRNLPSSPSSTTPTDNRIAIKQIIFLSSNPDGAINLADPMSFTDNGNSIDCRYQTGYYEEPGVMQIGAIGIVGMGSGGLIVKIRKDEKTAKTLDRKVKLITDSVEASIIKTTWSSPYFSIEFSNGNNPGDWFYLSEANLYTRTLFKTRRP